MDFFTHIIVSVAIANTLSQDEDSHRAFIIGGIAPDVDILVSWLSVLIPQLFILQHRGLFHTVLVAPFIAMGLILSTKYYQRFNFIKRLKEPFQEMYTDFNSKTVVWGVFGSLLHLFMDFITQGGLRLFYPLIYQRISIGTISTFDPLITFLSSVVVLRFFYSKLTGSNTYSLFQFKKSAKSISILFVILLLVYGLLQVNTIVTHSPTSTTPDSIPIFRWVVSEEKNVISIRIVNQLSQKIVKTYNYSPLTYNQTYWNNTTIKSIVEQAKGTIEYKKFEFQLGSETRLAVNVTFNEMENRWEILFIDALRDAQNRFYGIPKWFFIDTGTTIHLSQK